jgi:hypothetical protein
VNRVAAYGGPGCERGHEVAGRIELEQHVRIRAGRVAAGGNVEVVVRSVFDAEASVVEVTQSDRAESLHVEDVTPRAAPVGADVGDRHAEALDLGASARDEQRTDTDDEREVFHVRALLRREKGTGKGIRTEHRCVSCA